MSTRIQYWLSFSAGQGPAECAWAVVEVLQRLMAEAEAMGIATELLECVSGEGGRGAKSALLRLESDQEIESFLRSWTGTVQWIAKSPFRPEHKRKNWFVSVELLAAPEESATACSIDPSSLRWEVMRASGPGGQHVNRTESAVRLTHVPSGIQVSASEERSQLRNRRLAMARLQQRLQAEAAGKVAAEQKRRWASGHALMRGNAVRSIRGD